MDVYLLNGTSSVMPMGGTSSVMPMGGTSSVMPMAGTSAVMPMDGYDDEEEDVLVMQGWLEDDVLVPVTTMNGTIYVSPLALMDPDDVPEPMDGYGDASDAERNLYRAAYIVGDPVALQGIFKKFREKRKARKAEQLADPTSRQARKAERQAQRDKRRREGTRFIDRFGGAIANVGEALKSKFQAEASMANEGIEPDDEILTQRMAMEPRTGGGLMGWWQGLPMAGKIGVGLAGAFVLYKGLQMAGVIGKKRRK